MWERALVTMVFLLMVISFNNASGVGEKAIESTMIKDLDMYGNHIVWTDYRNDSSGDIYLFDIETGVETVICDNRHGQISPSIHKDTIVWEDYRGEFTSNIHVYNITSKIEHPIYLNDSYQLRPDIYGDKIVWYDKNENGSIRNIHLFYLQNHTEVIISNNSNIKKDPVISNDYIVWTEEERGADSYEKTDRDIVGFDLTSRERIEITNDSSDQNTLVIEDDIVCWSNSWWISVYNIRERKYITNVSVRVDESGFDYSNNTLVGLSWNIDKLSDELFVYNITNNDSIQIIKNERFLFFPVIHNNYIAWRQSGQSNSYIYYLNLRDDYLKPDKSDTEESTVSPLILAISVSLVLVIAIIVVLFRHHH